MPPPRRRSFLHTHTHTPTHPHTHTPTHPHTHTPTHTLRWGSLRLLRLLRPCARWRLRARISTSVPRTRCWRRGSRQAARSTQSGRPGRRWPRAIWSLRTTIRRSALCAGTCAVCAGPCAQVRRGTNGRAPSPRSPGTWPAWRTHTSTGVFGAQTPAHTPRGAGTWPVCSMRTSKDVIGAKTPAGTPRRADNWPAWRTRTSTGVSGTKTHASTPRRTDTWPVCSMRTDTCSSAAMRGHLACLQYAHEHGCPWNEKTCHFARKGGAAPPP